MVHLVCFFKDNVSVKKIKESLAIIFDVDFYDIKELFNDTEAIVKYEIRKLSINQDFNYELNLYVKRDSILITKLYNNLIFGYRFSKVLNFEILINDESDDPYQWILIEKNNLFLVEEKDTEEYGIDIIKSNRQKLNFNKAMKLLQNEEAIVNPSKANSVFYVSPSSKWNECID
ncbi:hypothetical protein [Tenacibaculum sp. 190524A02b]|uniref:hypothetical protein n=1 Tax=Tenacibaculum vairaonense TaxID=3137860 RepID=UPI0031FB0E93